MLPDQPYVRGLEEPLSASEYAKLEGLDENDVAAMCFVSESFCFLNAE
jgi:hypothetical protein